jgi:hypothetical protein
MNKDICTIPSCRNYERYCRIHRGENITPAKPINKESDKLKEDLKTYKKEARRFITQHPLCCICKQPATTIHHRAGRIGALLLDKTKWLQLCLPCHQKVTEDSAWAIKNGYSESRLKENA